MTKFIKVTSKLGRPILINVDDIMMVDVTSEDVVFINFAEDHYLEVCESFERVEEMLRG